MKDIELKEIASGIIDGSIFTHVQLKNESNLIPTVFMPLALMTKKDMNKFRKSKPGLIYEYIRAAGPRFVNGFPMFFSFRFLSKKDTKTVNNYCNQLIKERKQFLKEKV